jgi:hypothetical protein
MHSCEHYYCYQAGLQAFFVALFDEPKEGKSLYEDNCTFVQKNNCMFIRVGIIER